MYNLGTDNNTFIIVYIELIRVYVHVHIILIIISGVHIRYHYS